MTWFLVVLWLLLWLLLWLKVLLRRSFSFRGAVEPRTTLTSWGRVDGSFNFNVINRRRWRFVNSVFNELIKMMWQPESMLMEGPRARM